MQNRFKAALKDITQGLCNWRIWLLLGWQDIKLRYRRSQLGPFWLTISMAITIYSMGFLYGHLFKMDLKAYFPYLASGLLAWALIAAIVTEESSALIEGASYLHQVKLSYTIFILRVIVRNFIIFAHNILAIVPILIYYHVHVGWKILALPLGLMIFAINGLVFGVVLSMVCARFRDLGQIVLSLMQVIFFITPVMWMSSILPAKYHFIFKLNPFAQFISIIREPLLGMWPSTYNYVFTLSFTFCGIIMMLFIYTRAKHRVIYWL